jgi:hypothetical protein
MQEVIAGCEIFRLFFFFVNRFSLCGCNFLRIHHSHNIMWFLLKPAMNILFCPSNLPKRENHLVSSHRFGPLWNSVIGIKPPSVADTVHGDCPVAKFITLSNVVYKHFLRIMKLSLFILHLIITWARGQQSYIIFESYLICHLSEENYMQC